MVSVGLLLLAFRQTPWNDLAPLRRGFFFSRAYTLCGIAQKFTLPHGITTGTFAVVVGFPSSHSWSNNLSPARWRGFFCEFSRALCNRCGIVSVWA